MSRLTDAILAQGQTGFEHSPTVDLSYGGQNGHTAAIGRIANGKNYSEWISNQAHVQQNIIPVVLDYPRGIDFLPNKQKWIDQYNALMTVHPLTIEGLSSGLTNEFEQHAIGAAGEQQDELTKVSRAVSNVTMSYKEKNGKAIQKFVDYIIRYLYSDPDVEKPLVSNLPGFNPDSGLYTADYMSGTTLYIEPDVTQTHVVDAWLCTNQMFKGNGDRTGSRDIHSARKTIDLSLELTGITMANDNVRTLASTVLTNLNAGILGIDPRTAMPLPVTGVNPMLGSANGSTTVDYNNTPVQPGTNAKASPIVQPQAGL